MMIDYSENHYCWQILRPLESWTKRRKKKTKLQLRIFFFLLFVFFLVTMIAIRRTCAQKSPLPLTTPQRAMRVSSNYTSCSTFFFLSVATNFTNTINYFREQICEPLNLLATELTSPGDCRLCNTVICFCSPPQPQSTRRPTAPSPTTAPSHARRTHTYHPCFILFSTSF